jgi:hypothetical protein
MLSAIPTRSVFLLLCRDEDVRWLVGTAWKCFVFDTGADLDATLMCLEPYERHFDEESLELNLLLYLDSSNALISDLEWPCLPKRGGSVWVGYTFKKIGKMNDMIDDIESTKSVWSREAVPKYPTSVRLPRSALKSKEGRVIVIRQVDLPVTMLEEMSAE